MNKRFTCDDQTIMDLEFEAIRDMLAAACVEETARDRMKELLPLSRIEEAERALSQADELLRIRTEESGFPRIEFQELTGVLKTLSLRGSLLQLDGFVRLIDAANLVNDLIHFFNKREEYPELTEITKAAYFSQEVIEPIQKVLDARMQVKDNASDELFRIRNDIKRTRKEINRNFDRVLRKLQKDGFLGETVETYINNRRVLSVISSYKRQVGGHVVGASNSGGFTYIEPQVNLALNNEMEMLLEDERSEIRKIFLALTDQLRGKSDLINAYQFILTEFDFIQAKVKVAISMNAVRPALVSETMVELIKSYHPLLYLTNKALGKKTIPQSLVMDKFSRMMVISGPNAGGKSITLKTVGLLQIMVQSGLLIPADPSSKCGWFNHVLSDIGDNQSIENQLSTYSYRLKRMKFFLEIANKRTLLLLDEFGTGSDPELGGALAEVFFETLYNRKSFGVITTHYANIKLKAARLRNAVNSSMLFDRQSLEPKYELAVGQPGSSFTFEVAEINGIDQDLISEAKKRLDVNKLELDQLISSLQKEKSELETLSKESDKAREEAEEAKEEYESLADHFEQKLIKQQEVAEKNNKDLSNGKRMTQFIASYKLKGSNKALLEEVKKFIAVEKTKLEQKRLQAKAKAKKQQVQREKIKDKAKKKTSKAKPKPVKPIVVGSRVRLKGGSQKGEVVELKGTEATVLFGNFKTLAKVATLESVD